MVHFSHFDASINFIKQAADHLRKEAEQRLGIHIGSGHAHNLVAATLGEKSAAALKTRYPVDDPWLGLEDANISTIEDQISRMREPTVMPSQAPLIGGIIRDGLTPACAICGTLSSSNFPPGDVELGDTSDDYEWICGVRARHDSSLGQCRCCDSGIVFRLDDLDAKGLCQVCKGRRRLCKAIGNGWRSVRLTCGPCKRSALLRWRKACRLTHLPRCDLGSKNDMPIIHFVRRVTVSVNLCVLFI